MFCQKCGTQLDGDAKFCAKCGTPTQDPGEQATSFAPTPMPPAQQYTMPATPPAYQPQPATGYNPPVRKVSTFKPLSLIAIIICAILWFAAPFMAVNLLTLGEQPTALQLLTGDVFALGDMTDTPAFWASLVSAIGIGLCLLCILIKKNGGARVVAILVDILLILAAVMMADYGLEAIGFGYIAIFIIFFAICFTSGRKKKSASIAPQPVTSPMAPPPAPNASAMPVPQQSPQAVPAPTKAAVASDTCAACGRALREEEWKCPDCGAFRE